MSGVGGGHDVIVNGLGEAGNGFVGEPEHAVRSDAIAITDIVADLSFQSLFDRNMSYLDRRYSFGSLKIKLISEIPLSCHDAVIISNGRIVARLVGDSGASSQRHQGSDSGNP